jgi:hypothetical protein
MAPPVLFLRTYDLTIWLLRKLQNIPRTQRQFLGQRTADCALDLLDTINAAAWSSAKARPLRDASSQLNRLRLQLRLLHDLKCIPSSSYFHAIERLEEIGKMLGGWVKHQDAKP